MKTFRLHRLFHSTSNRCFDVALDHGFFNERAFLAGIENLAAAVQTLVAAAPDAIQLTVGQAALLQSIPGRQKPALVLRTDVANVYGSELPRALFSRMIAQPVEQALRLDAACVVVNLFRIPGEPEVSDQCIQNILEIKPAVRSLRYAADDRAARLSSRMRKGRRLPWSTAMCRQDSAARASGGGTRRGYHQGRSNRRRRASTIEVVENRGPHPGPRARRR